MELKPCQIAIAVSLIIMLLLLTIGGQGTAATGDECSLISRSKTFKGVCHSRVLCVATCRGEGHAAGYCFLDVADPDHRVCMCTKPCPPEPATTTTAATSRGNMLTRISGSSNGDGVVERAEELQRRGRAQPPGAVVPVRPPAVLRQRHHLRPRHHVRRVDARPATPCPPRRLLARGLRVRPLGSRHRAGELRAVQGVGGVPLPVGDAGGARDPGAGGAGAGQLGEGAGVGGGARRPGDVPGQPGAVGVAADHPGDRVRGHRVRGAPAHHGEGPREEEVPGRRLRPARLLQGPRQVRGVQAQGDQERPPRHARVRRLLRAAVGVPRHRAPGEPGHPPRRPVAQQHRRHHHPQIDLSLS